MGRYIFFRILGILAVLLIVSMMTFTIMHTLPGGPWDMGQMPLTGAARENMLHLYGLDKPIWQQYLTYIGNALKLDFGVPYSSPEMTVVEVFQRSWPVSLKLAGITMVIFFPLGLALGLVAALNRGSWVDRLVSGLSVAGILIPPYVWAFVFIMIFAVSLKWVPVMGWDDSRYWIIPGVLNSTYFLPVTIWGLNVVAPISRYTRSSIIEAVQQDYIRTARAKGLTEKMVLWRHVMRNAVIPIIAVVIPMIPMMVTGNSWLEMIFGIPGIGRFYIEAALKRDYVMIMAVMLLWSFLLSLFNLLADLMYVAADPRIRLTARE